MTTTFHNSLSFDRPTQPNGPRYYFVDYGDGCDNSYEYSYDLNWAYCKITRGSRSRTERVRIDADMFNRFTRLPADNQMSAASLFCEACGL